MSGEPDSTWMDAVRDKVVECFSDSDPETMVRILGYLNEEESAHGDPVRSQTLKTLRAALKSDGTFRMYVQRLNEDIIRRVEGDQQAAEPIAASSSQPLTRSVAEVPESYAVELEPGADLEMSGKPDFTWMDAVRDKVVECFGNSDPKTTVRVLGYLKEEESAHGDPARSQTLKTLRAALKMDGTFRLYVQRLDEDIKRRVEGHQQAAEPIAASSSNRKRCWKGVLGSKLRASIANLLSVPNSEALKNAYRFLGVKMTASNDEINRRFHQLCLQYHPDKGGASEKFHELQVHMGLIRIERNL